MAGGNKKKKTKPVANPARGFATTSLPKASKLKEAEDADVVESTDASGKATPDTVPTSAETVDTSIKPQAPSSQRELHELSPEELESQLEASELQQFVEHHAAKVRKESARQVSRLETDKRVLRGQADFLSIKAWLPEELMLQILDLALADSDHDHVPPKKQGQHVGDDLLSKVWTLRLCLLAVDISVTRVNEVLAWLISHPPVRESAGSVWGLPEVLEWLALHIDSNELLEYDYEKPKSVAEDVSDDSEPFAESREENGNGSTTSKKRDSPLSVTNEHSELDGDVHVSDVESDIEPDELLSSYLRVRARLFELNPSAEDNHHRKKSSRSMKSAASPNAAQTRVEQRLLQKLQKIERDALFDQREADEIWVEKKAELAREAAERRRLQLSQHQTNASGPTTSTSDSPGNRQQHDVSEEAEKLGLELLEETEDLEGADMLSGMFDALPGVQDSAQTNGDASTTAHVTIRDFGRLVGMSPKRVLEEACKARDSQARLAYRQVSPTTYASRHSLTVSWSKDQDVLDGSAFTAVATRSTSRLVTFTMLEEATPDLAQSEAYIATVALFVIFSGSPKEEKAHLRLPPALRNFWDELAQKKSEHSDARDRDTVKDLRKLIDRSDKPEDDDKDEVVFKAGSRHWSGTPSRISTPVIETERDPVSEPSQELQDLWARKISTPYYQKMLLSRMNLPIFHFKAAILDAIDRNQVTILVSETGSGKSTQLPAYILERQLSQGRHCKVYCTEPRRISAISLAQRVSEEMGERKGDVGTARSLVGYAIRLESHTTQQTRLVYATTGIVLRMLENSDGLKEATHLILDEVHERSIDSDFLLIMLRSLLDRRPELKVVLMSATVDARRFSDYLNGAPIIDVPGRTFPVQARFLEDAIELTGHTNEDAKAGMVEDDNDDAETDAANDPSKKGALAGYSKRTINTLAGYDEYRIDYSLIMKLLQKVASPSSEYIRYSKAVLIFLPGIAEIRQLNDMLTTHPIFSQGWRIHPLHSSFSSEDQQAAFDIPPPGIRKIVLATNIAETGITIPDVTCVIDTGKHKEMRFDEKRQMSRLILSFIARANAKQRRGRAGRVQEGICFHLYTKARFDGMAENQTPEMLRLSLQDLVMRVKICKLGDIEQTLSEALDPPSSKNIRRAIDALIEVEALTRDEALTPLGQQLAKIPLDAQLGKLILLGTVFGCLDFALTAAAALTSKTPFLSPMHAKKQADTVRLGFKRGDSDLLTVYNAYSAWRKICTTSGMSEYQFCNKNFLSAQNLANIEDLKAQLLSSLVDAGFVHLSPEERSALSRVRPGSRQRNFVMLGQKYCRADDNDSLVDSVVGWSFYPKVIKREGKGWRNISNNQTLGLHPASVNKVGMSPEVKLLSFYSIMQSSSRFTNAQETTPVPEIPLILLAGDVVFHLYAGVIVVDSNRLRYKVRDWKTMIVLKTLRTKIKEVLARVFRSPGRELVGRQQVWMGILEKMFEGQKKS